MLAAGTKSVIVLSLDGPGNANTVQSLDLTPLAKGSVVIGMEPKQFSIHDLLNTAVYRVPLSARSRSVYSLSDGRGQAAKGVQCI